MTVKLWSVEPPSLFPPIRIVSSKGDRLRPEAQERLHIFNSYLYLYRCFSLLNFYSRAVFSKTSAARTQSAAARSSLFFEMADAPDVKPDIKPDADAAADPNTITIRVRDQVAGGGL